MKNRNLPKILILGANGMLGSAIFRFFRSIYPDNTLGTVRDKSFLSQNIVYFDAQKFHTIRPIMQLTKGPFYIINCIGILPQNTSKSSMYYINGEFPHLLAKEAQKYQAYLIHVSTDAVYSPTDSFVFEDSVTMPTTEYGKSKLAGEPSCRNTISIRTSIIGFDHIAHKGILEWSLTAKNIKGYINQTWSGCTTYQFAKLCNQILKRNIFLKMNSVSYFFNFAPLSNYSKHDIIKTFLSIKTSGKVVLPEKGEVITRILQTKYAELLGIKSQNNNLSEALKDLIAFDQGFGII